ncbi:MAG TPA: hypothetical protein VL337_14455 [Acidimicrobiales bacterium]|nr:hypothetical protein [Acidimicrobiales bacterium]
MALVDAEPAVLVFSVRVGSGDSWAPTLLAQELTVALTDARVRGPFWYSIDASLPAYQLLPRWQPPPSVPGQAAAHTTGVVTFATQQFPSTHGPATGTGDPTHGLELVGTLSERVSSGAARLATAWREAPGSVVASCLAALLLLATVVITQMRWPGSETRSHLPEFLWFRDHRLAVFFVFSVCVALATQLVAGGDRQPYARVAEVLAPLPWAAAAGMAAGGLARLQRTWGAVGGAGVLFAVGWAWRRAGYVRRRLPRYLLRLASLAGFVALIGLYGRARGWSYYSSMGVRPSAVDIPAVDAIVLAARPVALALVTVAAFLAVAWFVSGHVPMFPGPVLTLVALVAAVSILVGQLGVDRNYGRRVAEGRVKPPTEHVSFDPGPTSVCLEWIAPELAQAMPGPLPRLVWQIATAGSDTLLLDPEVARTTHGDQEPDPSASRPDLRHGDVDAPIWYVAAGQFLRRQSVNGRCES